MSPRKTLFAGAAGLMPGAASPGPPPACCDPVLDGGLVRAGIYANLGYGKVASLVQVAFVTADGDAGAFGQEVTAPLR
jgi:hypothetical protein